MTTTAAIPAGLKDLLRLQLRPYEDMHPSWLPPTWPSRWRPWQALGPAGQAALAAWLQSHLPALDGEFGQPRRRLLLMDGPSLRRLAFYGGLALHGRWMGDRDSLGSELRRQARRVDDDAVEFVLHRLPHPSAFRIDPESLRAHPIRVGRVVLDRGYRLLQALIAVEGEPVLARAQRKLPRRAALLRPLSLQPRQLAQLDELMLMCIIPERLPQWDWLT